MKKLTLYLMTALLWWSFTPAVVAAESTTHTPKSPTQLESAEAKALINRLEEIKSIDKSGMKPLEKKALRKEVRSIKKTLAQTNGGVYLSVGAIIIIILLLILLL